VKKLKVLLLIPHLGGGGAEHVTALLARGLSREKYELHLGLVTQGDVGEEAPPHWVAVHALGASRVRRAALQLVRLVRGIEPDVILSGMAHLNFLVLLLRPFYPRKTRVLVRQNGTVSAILASREVPCYTRLLYHVLYRRADRIICQSRAMAEDLAGELRITEEQIAVLPNPVDFDGIRCASEGPDRWTQLGLQEGPRLLAVGRLASEKGYDMLLHAFAAVREQLPAASLIIAGAGPEESRLKAQCRSLGIERSVRMLGLVKQPYAYYPGASIYVLSSRQEGLPNSLIEALVGGLPVVATPASGGITDLLRAQPGTWLAPGISVSALSATLLFALGSLSGSQRFQRSFSNDADRAESVGRGPGIQSEIR
jgi:glycosyltransferase involved in cell wall biosynthesis